MKPQLLVILCGLFLLSNTVNAQFTTDNRTFEKTLKVNTRGNVNGRSSANPTQCNSDTSLFTYYEATRLYTVSILNGSSLGQYFGVPQTITISGFRFFGYALPATPQKLTVRLICHIYKAGADSLPTGSPLGSDTISVDTVMGTSIPLNRITRNAVFKSPVTLNSGGYILVVACDSTNVRGAVVTNSWLNFDGGKKNLGCGSVSGKWYRCLQLNISGNQFDADMQFYPFVKYKFGTDFTIDKNCYSSTDTLKFTNLYKNNISGSIYYNRYNYYGYDYICHRWTYDNLGSTYVVNGLYKPPVKKDVTVRLISSVYSYSGGICYDTTTKIDYFKPDLPYLKKTARACKGDTVTIDVGTDAAATLNWYKKLSDITPFFVGSSYKINNAQQNDSFYVQAVNGACKTGFVKINFNVYDYPNNPKTTGDSICIGAVANLGATSNLGVLDWYTQKTGGFSVFRGNNMQTGKLTSDTFFYVQANNNGCLNKGGRVLVEAKVNNSFAPSKPITHQDTSVCFRPTKTVNLKATQAGSDTLRWFTVPFGGNVVAKGEDYAFNPKGRGDEYYYVETWNGVCGSGRVEIKVMVFDYPDIYGKTDITICSGESAKPTLSSTWGDIHWYADKTSSPFFTGPKPILSGLTKNTVYYLKSEENGCLKPTFDSIKIIVNKPPVPSVAKADPVCAKGIGNFEVTIPNGKVEWFYEAIDTVAFYVGSKITEGPLLSNVTYYYRTVGNGCASAKTPLTIVLKPRPTAGFTWTLQWQNRLICTPITTSGLTITWDWGDGNTSVNTPFNHQYAAKGNYTVRMVATSSTNGCKDTADIPVVVDHTGIVNTGITHTLIYPIPVAKGGVLHTKGMNQSLPIQIYSMQGQLVGSAVMVNGEFVVPANINSGMYIAIAGQDMHTFKFIVGD